MYNNNKAHKVCNKEIQKIPIQIWGFHDAPEQFKNLSHNGGDEDWIALIPPDYIEKYIPFLDCDCFGCCSIDEFYIHEGYYNGYKILIGCHA